jgi:hypothetical protein
MRRLAIVIPGTHGAAFYSQIAAIAVAVRSLPWQRWKPSIHAFLGPAEAKASSDGRWQRWAPFLRDVDVRDVDSGTSAALGNWAQVDAALEEAPAEAEVILCLDADTLPVASFEDVLDTVASGNLVAGVMAHYPPPGIGSRDDWRRIGDGCLTRPLVFEHTYSLVPPDAASEDRVAPFYVNGGVMFFSRNALEQFVPMYLDIRRNKLVDRMPDEAFTGQVASSFAISEGGLRTWPLPMRYNFPNDPAAEALYPGEAERVVIHHYLRTGRFDRHRIFTTADEFARFLDLPLQGADSTFRSEAIRVLGSDYPFDTVRYTGK